MGQYLDRLRARNSANTLGNQVPKVPKVPQGTPFGTFGTPFPSESRKISGPRVTLAEYGAILNGAVTGTDLPPIPPYRLGDAEHEAAWSAWWNTLELQRAHRRKDAAP